MSVRILGKLGKRGAGLTAEKFPGRRLHVRAIVRDGRQAFVGSQGLRKLELDGRREVGVIVKDPKVVARMAAIFEADWAETDRARKDVKDAKKDEKAEAKAEGQGGGQSSRPRRKPRSKRRSKPSRRRRLKPRPKPRPRPRPKPRQQNDRRGNGRPRTTHPPRSARTF